jgi:hypothetical protein
MPGALFLLSHNDSSGRPRLDTDLLNCGLMAAQLADLVLSAGLDVFDHQSDVRMAVRRGGVPAPAGTDVERFVVHHIGVISRVQNPTVTLLGKAIGVKLHDVVLNELVREGTLKAENSRGLARRLHRRYRIASPTRAMYPRFTLLKMLENPALITVGGGFLVCLIDLLCAGDLLRDDGITRSRIQHSAESIREILPADLRKLLNGTREAAGAIVHRLPGGF